MARETIELKGKEKEEYIKKRFPKLKVKYGDEEEW